MGLDMYIFARQKGKPKIDPDTGEIVGTESAYWRKAWMIRHWLEEHQIIEVNDNCRNRHISREQIALLKRECDVLLNIQDDYRFFEDLSKCYGFILNGFIDRGEAHTLAEELEETSEQLANLLYEFGQDYEFFYYDSW